MLPFFIVILLVGIASWLITAWVYRSSGSWNLLQPSNHRSSHLDPTPYCGGIGFVVSTTLLALWLGWQGAPGLSPLFALALVLAAVGLADDIWIIAVRFRLVVHVLIVSTAVLLVEPIAYITLQLGLGVDLASQPLIHVLLTMLVVLTGVWWVNLFNFMDGIDGLAALQTIAMLGGAALAMLAQNPGLAMDPVYLLMLALTSATIGFLVLNWPPAKIFMGDVGSTWLAFVIFAIALLSIDSGWLNIGAWLILSTVFVCDATVTLLTRMFRGERWFEAHRTHAYQVISLRLWSGYEARGSSPNLARARAQRAVIVGVFAFNLGWVIPLALLTVFHSDLTLLWLALAYLPAIVTVLRVRRRRAIPVRQQGGRSRAVAAAAPEASPRLDFLMITRDPELARLADNCGVGRLFVDLEILGKLERQGHLDTHISDHSIDDVARVKAALRQAELLVRVNPLNPETAQEIDSAIEGGADILMLPMYRTAEEVRRFVELVNDRVPVMLLLETAGAAEALPEVVRIPGVSEIYIGLNDLHLDLGLDFIFEPLANGTVDRLVETIRAAGLPFGFGGVARVDEGLVPGNLVLGEHLRLGSSWVILSRTFQRDLVGTDAGAAAAFSTEIGRLQDTIDALRLRDAERIEADRLQFCALVEKLIAAQRRRATG